MTKLLAYQYRMQVDELDEEDDQNKSDWMKGETEQYLDRRTAITICSVSYVYCVNDR